MKNCRIMQTVITPEIYVSTAAIWYDGVGWQRRFQYETWCFSDDHPTQHSFQVIHGSCGWIDFHYLKKSIKIHRHISNNLTKRQDENKRG